jgi:hypothetical protein
VPYPQAQSCLRELRSWFDSEFADPNGIRPHCSLEIRFSDADDIWLSPSYGQKTCWIGIMQYRCVASSFVVPITHSCLIKALQFQRSISYSLRSLRAHNDSSWGTSALGQSARPAPRHPIRTLSKVQIVQGTIECRRPRRNFSERVRFKAYIWSNRRALWCTGI